ncbi:MAG: hypothetical protein V4502_00885 [Pseudomonadota bacterium]
MTLRCLLFAAAASLSCVAQPAFAQDSLAADAKAFGAREAVLRPDLSADGSSVVYVTPGQGRTSVAVVGNLDTGKFAQVAGSPGGKMTLRWCNFVSASRAVCRITGLNTDASTEDIIGFSRLLAINTDGTEPKQLGQSESFYDAYLRQFDAAVVDWLDGTDGKVLLERHYVPEEGKLGTRLVRQKQGLGVDIVDTKTLSSNPSEEPRDGASSYMSDGQGHVRLMMTIDSSHTTGTLSGQASYHYRTANSRRWQLLRVVRPDQARFSAACDRCHD